MPQTGSTNEDRIVNALETFAATQAAMIANTPPRKVSYAEHLAKKPKKPELPAPFFINGIRSDEYLTAEQVVLIGQLQEGWFCGRKIRVYRDNGPDRAWHLDKKDKEADDRMELKSYGRNLTEILERIATDTPDLD